MCIAILNVAGVTISDETLRRCWASNPDGGGLAYVRTQHGLPMVDFFKSLDKEEFIAAYQMIRESLPDSNMLVHFRVTTHGGTNIQNTHPFPVTSGEQEMMLIHNGIINGYGSHGKSDTNEFCSSFLSLLPPGWEHHKQTHTLIESLIGWSKLVLLREDNQFFIINEDSGTWDLPAGGWFSNGGYKSYSTGRNYPQGYRRGYSTQDADYYDAFEEYEEGRSATYTKERQARITAVADMVAAVEKKYPSLTTKATATDAASVADVNDATFAMYPSPSDMIADGEDMTFPGKCPSCRAESNEIEFDASIMEFWCHGCEKYITQNA